MSVVLMSQSGILEFDVILCQENDDIIWLNV